MSLGTVLPTRMLGGIASSALGFGCMGVSEREGPRGATRVLRHAVEAGITLFDTAELYGPFTNEELVGEALASMREKVLIATKFGAQIEGGRPVGMNSRPEHVMASAEASLRRLRTDRIDIFYQHRVDPDVPIEDVAGAVARLIEAGKVRAFGLSEVGAETLRRAHAVQPVAAVQSEYSLWTRDPEVNGVLAACEELSVGFVAFCPLGRGFLTGAVDPAASLGAGDPRAGLPRFQADAMRANTALLALVRKHAGRIGATPAQLALAWLLGRRPWIVPIPGTTYPAHIDENLAATGVRIGSEEVAEFEAALSATPIEGARYPEYLLAMTGL